MIFLFLCWISFVRFRFIRCVQLQCDENVMNNKHLFHTHTEKERQIMLKMYEKNGMKNKRKNEMASNRSERNQHTTRRRTCHCPIARCVHLLILGAFGLFHFARSVCNWKFAINKHCGKHAIKAYFHFYSCCYVRFFFVRFIAVRVRRLCALCTLRDVQMWMKNAIAIAHTDFMRICQ